MGCTAAGQIELGLTSVEKYSYPQGSGNDRSTVRESIARGCSAFELEHRFVTEPENWPGFWFAVTAGQRNQLPDLVLFDITLRKRMEEELRLSEEKSRIAFQHTDKIMAVYDPVGHTLFQTGDAAAVLGVPTEMPDVPKSFVANGLVAEEALRKSAALLYSMRQGIPSGSTSVKLKTGSSFEWFTGRYTLIFDVEGKPQRSIISYENVTEQRERELAYRNGFRPSRISRKTASAIMNSI